jgi:hypothetical protein
MKKIFLLLFLFSFSLSYAQVDRSIGGGQYKNDPKKETKVDHEKAYLELLKKKVGVDNLQEKMIRVYYQESYIKIEKIIDTKDLNDVEKTKKIEEIQDEMNTNILKILDDNQKTKFEKLMKK